MGLLSVSALGVGVGAAPALAARRGRAGHRLLAPLKKGSPAWKRAHPWRGRGGGRGRGAGRGRAARTGQPAAEVVTLIHLHTGERLAVARGARPPQALVDRFLRCRWTDRVTHMDPRPLTWALQGAAKFHVLEVHVISGFRHPKFNRVLWKKGRQVARWSKHRLGHALDFRLVGADLDQVYRYFRKRRLGGVGRYPRSKFLHLDTGRVRTWGGD